MCRIIKFNQNLLYCTHVKCLQLSCLVSVVVTSLYTTGLSFIIATSPHHLHITVFFPVQLQWGITYNCLVGLFLSHVSPNSAFLTSGVWLSQKPTCRVRERGRQRECRKKESTSETERETGHSTAPGCETLPIFSSHTDLFLSDRIISMHSTGEWKLPFTHKNMARIVSYLRGLFFSLCHPFAYSSYEKVLLM